MGERLSQMALEPFCVNHHPPLSLWDNRQALLIVQYLCCLFQFKKMYVHLYFYSFMAGWWHVAEVVNCLCWTNDVLTLLTTI